MTGGDTPIQSRTGATHGGLPLSFGRMPAADLSPWVARLSVSEVVLPEGELIDCRTFNDYSVLRIIFGARWSAVTADGTREFDPGERGISLFFGPHSHAMRLKVYGSFKILSLNLRAGASPVLGGPRPGAVLDRIIDYDAYVGHGRLSAHFARDASPETWIRAMEDRLRAMIARDAPLQPNPLIQAFAATCLADPNIAVGRFAELHEVTPRTVERTIRRGFGLTPKQVLRRARALDMAAMLLGVALAEEETEMRLRYSDESHLIREMRRFFDMTPGQMRNGLHPLLRITLEIRQQRRMEALELLGLSEPRPWRDPSAEPAAGG